MTDRLLRSALTANALVTLLCGAIAALGAGALAPRLGLDSSTPMWVVAAIYLGFGALLARTALRPGNLPLEAKLLSVMDVGYVAASIGLVTLFPDAINGIGKTVVLGVAAVVVVLVGLQVAGLRRLGGDAAQAPSQASS